MGMLLPAAIALLVAMAASGRRAQRSTHRRVVMSDGGVVEEVISADRSVPEEMCRSILQNSNRDPLDVTRDVLQRYYPGNRWPSDIGQVVVRSGTQIVIHESVRGIVAGCTMPSPR